MALVRSPQRTTTSTERGQDIDVNMNVEEAWEELRREREQFEKRKTEFEKKMANVASGTRSRTKKTIEKTAENEAVEVDFNAVSGFINQIQHLQIDVKVQKFSDESQRNPNEFLDEIEKYFKARGVRDEQKIIVFENFLEGRARLWAETMGSGARSYAMFKQRFLDEFYSIPIQVKLKNQWLSRRYRQSDGTLQFYFYEQMRSARYFEPVMSTYEINYAIAQQFPMRIREALSTVDYSQTMSMAQALAQLELIQKERENDRRRNNWDDRGQYGQRNGLATRAMQGNRWTDAQAYTYRNRRFDNYYANTARSYRDHREWRGPYYRDNREYRNDAMSRGFPDMRVPPPGYERKNDFHQNDARLPNRGERIAENRSENNLN